MRYVKYTPWRSIKNASRDIREIACAKKRGYEVMLFSNDKEADVVRNYVGTDIGFLESRVTELNDSMNKFEKIYATVSNYFQIIPKTIKLNADVLSCHDLNSLLPAYLATRFAKKKPLLVYDSHEFELGRNKKRNKLKIRFIKWLEGYLINKCLATIVVNDSIADRLVDIHYLKKRPIVVRSTPENWHIDETIIYENRIKLCENYNISKDSFITMYHGNITQNRGIEEYLQVIRNNPEIVGVFMGNSSDKYLECLKELICELGISKRVIFLKAVKNDDIWRYVGGADVSIVTIPARCESYYYMLPNKFLESIQSLTPIIGSDFPEIKKIMNHYKIGLLCNPDDINDISMQVNTLRHNKELYQQLKNNLRVAKEDLCWEKEQTKLNEMFVLIETETNKYV